MNANTPAPDEQAETSAPRPPPWKRVRVWLVGLVLASVTAAVSSLVTDALTGAGQSLRRIISGDNREVIIKDEQGPILGVHVEQGDGDGCNAPGWVYPESPAAPIMNRPPGTGIRKDGKTWDQDPPAFGAAPAGPVTLYISARARDERAIIIHDIRFRVVERRPPIHGTRISLAGGCGDSPTYHVGRVNFAARPPYWVPAGDFMEGFRKDELKFPYTATESDPATLLIDVTPGNCHCAWKVELRWTDGKLSGTTVIDDNGKPFQITDSSGLPVFTWQEGKRVPDDRW
ncbi:hypothetical protein ACIPYQ_37675 [Streptomyces sp. NPDC090045]|uniref:hypothetical protein n=1 Tax=Streptomyces sp. NPDC090045 TaxID=3365927 RepID=UPI00383078C0